MKTLLPNHLTQHHPTPAPRGGRPAFAATLLLAGVLCGLAGAARAQGIARGGSPLYLMAVRESVQGLRSKAAGAQANARANAQAQAQALARARAAAAAAAVQGRNAGTNLVAGVTNRVGLTPDFLRRYYFCTNCQAWHLRSTPLPVATLNGRPGSGLAPALTNLVPRRTNVARPAPAPAPPSR